MADRRQLWTPLPRELAGWWRRREAGATAAPEQLTGGHAQGRIVRVHDLRAARGGRRRTRGVGSRGQATALAIYNGRRRPDNDDRTGAFERERECGEQLEGGLAPLRAILSGGPRPAHGRRARSRDPGAVARPGRDAARTRVAILDCAERLFAEKGYPATSLQEIGQVAGFSRGAPGYFFGAKRQLYAAVVERIIRRAEEFFPEGDAPRAGEEALAEVVSRYMDFLVSEPTFVRLMHAEGLDVPNAAGTRALEIARTQLERAGVSPSGRATLR